MGTSNILIIEDDDDIRKNVCLLLELEGYSVRSAPDGEQGWKQIAQKPHPDLVLCDLLLPGMDGFAVLEKVRSNPLLAELPFLILTALTDRASQRKGMNLGADDFLTKPFSAEELLLAIQVRLQRRPKPQVLPRVGAKELEHLALLTERERQILVRIGQGQTSRMISEGLGISPKTEQAHRARLMVKLDLHTAQALAALAVRAQLA